MTPSRKNLRQSIRLPVFCVKPGNRFSKGKISGRIKAANAMRGAVLSWSRERKERYGFLCADKNGDGTGSGRRHKKGSSAWFRRVIQTNGEEL